MFESFVLVLPTILCGVVTGELIQVSNNLACSSDPAVFICNIYGDDYQNWFIRAPTIAEVNFNLNSFDHPRGTRLMREVASVPVSFTVTVTSANNSSISATLNISNPVHINGSTVECNFNRLPLTVGDVPPPTEIDISKNEKSLIITWNSTNSSFYYQILSGLENWTDWSSERHPLIVTGISNLTEISLSSCFNAANVATFDISSCLIGDMPIDRRYTLDQLGNWTIFEYCPPLYNITTKCDSLKQWNSTICPETMKATSGGIDSTLYTTSQTTSKTSTKKQNVNLILVIVPIISVVIIVTILVVAVPIIKVTRNKRKQMSSGDCHNEAGPLGTMYQPLSHKKFSPRNVRLRSDNDMLTQDPGQYSTIDLNQSASSVLSATGEYHRIAHPLSSKSCKNSQDHHHYNVLETNDAASFADQSNGYCETPHVANSKYADVDTSGQNGATGGNVIHIKVDYTDICLDGRPEDESLNLDTLLIQLNPISKDFRLFGSVAGISPEFLDEITDSCAAPYDGLVEVCDAWLDKCRREKTAPTWSAVAEILSLIGHDEMAELIMQVYVTGELPIIVDMNSVNIQGPIRLPTPPPPIPPHKDEDTFSEVEKMTVMSVLANKQSKDMTMEDEPPPIPERPPDLMTGEENEESQQALPELPPKLPGKVQTKPTPAKRCLNDDDKNIPSLPPRPPKNK